MSRWWRVAWRHIWALWQVTLCCHLLVALAFVFRWIYLWDEDASFILAAYLGGYTLVILIVLHRHDLLVLTLGLCASALASAYLLPAAGSHRTLAIWSGAIAVATTWWFSRSLTLRLVRAIDNPRLSRLRPHLRQLPTEAPATLLVLVTVSAAHALAEARGFSVGVGAMLLTPAAIALASFRSLEEFVEAATLLRALTRKIPTEFRLTCTSSIAVATALALGMPAETRGMWANASRLTGALIFGSGASVCLVASILMLLASAYLRWARLMAEILTASEQSELDAAMEDLDL